MSRYVAVKIYGKITVHLPHTTGNYYTLCGLDGNDEDRKVEQITVDVPIGWKVDCEDCIRIWSVCNKYSEKDFKWRLTNEHDTDQQNRIR
jgi:hypothetical protein